MTATEWATSTDPEAMLAALDDANFGTARLPVVLAGFAERGWLPATFSQDFRHQFLAYSRWVFGLGARPLPIELPMFEPPDTPNSPVFDAEEHLRFAFSGAKLAWRQLFSVMLAEAIGRRRVNLNRSHRADPATQIWFLRQADALRDALGNPFAPVAWNPSWRTETVTALATGIHFDNAFDRLPILADALEEAGCDSAEVLAHCRGPGPHARGCWVVDAARGR
ncbi:MAG: hypothetical protein MUF18_16825 [Fimbriiglobus sp.]|jgi:hypothetical protein|nr:hypothetical protein [Fimbriiglobus sp.]